MTEAIVAMGRTLGLRTVAEGVEARGQAAALAAMGCGLGQGYLWSRPVPAADLPGLLAAPALPLGATAVPLPLRAAG